jgi:hypothetical protein
LNLREARALSEQGRAAVAAAQETVLVTREIGEAQVRAYLRITSVVFGRSSDERHASVEFVLNNAESSPALSTKAHVRIVAAVYGDTIKPKTMEFCTVLNDAPQGESRSGVLIHVNASMPETEFGESWELLRWAYVGVTVFAKDVFEREINTFGPFSRSWDQETMESRIELSSLDPVTIGITRENQIKDARQQIATLWPDW